MKGQIEIVSVEQHARWNEILSRTDGFDFYHTPEYHQLAEAVGEGAGVLFVFSDSSRLAAWPFLLRQVRTVPGLEGVDKNVRDATSVYGYCGPVFSASARHDPEFLRNFGDSLCQAANELRLVSLFSRMHPLLNNAHHNLGFGVLVPTGETVSIDLTQSNSAQWLAMRKNHRYEIRKAQSRNVHVLHDDRFLLFDQFIKLYIDTMGRVGAAPYYFFSPEYFCVLRAALHNRLHLFVAEFNGEIHSACLFVLTGSIIQCHFSANDVVGRKLAATKLVLNEARLWGKSIGAKVLHLGGGVGSERDSLLAFKEGFSKIRHTFHTWRYVVNPNLYQDLVAARRSWLSKHALMLPVNSFFPLYRAQPRIDGKSVQDSFDPASSCTMSRELTLEPHQLSRSLCVTMKAVHESTYETGERTERANAL